MSKPPIIDDFSFDTPDADTVAENRVYLTAVKKVIMELRNSVKIKGVLAADLMELYGAINNPVIIEAKFDHYAHPRHLSGDVACKFNIKNICLLFDVVLLIHDYQLLKDNGNKYLDNRLKHLNTVLSYGLRSYHSVGDERDGYVLKRR